MTPDSRRAVKPEPLPADAQPVDLAALLESAEPQHTEEPAQPASRGMLLRAWMPSAAVLAAAAWWLIVATRWWGGRDAGAVSGGALLTAVALVAVRPDRLVPRSALLTAAGTSVGALVVAATAPTGWAGAANAADYVCAAWTVVGVAAAVVRDPRIVRPLLALLMLGVFVEIEESWAAWWGGGDPAAPITGTFYWWDPFAAYLIPGTVVAYAVYLRGRRYAALIGLAGLVLGTIGLAYSTSRAAAACFVVAVAAVSVCHMWRGWRAAGRVAAGLVITGIAAWFVGGPPFFPGSSGGVGGSPLAGTTSRASGQSLSQNGGYRLQFWHEALRVFERHPIVGGGYHSLATESAGHVPHGWALSPLAHSGYLQAASDGGLVLAVPFLLGCGAIIMFVLFGLKSALVRRDASLTGFVLPLVLGALLAHSAVDFDWSYPADFVLVALLAGLVAGMRWRNSSAVGRPGRLTACAVLVGVVTLAIGAQAAWSGDMKLNLPVTNNSATGPAR